MGNFAKQMKRKQLQKTNKGAARGIRQANRADKQVMTAYERQNVTDMLTEIKTAQDDGLAKKEFTMEDLKELLTGEAKYTSEAVA